ncbi:MAG: hypothetical protein II467_02225 [Bacilli bacterium]|nr:hypothetical protein [Bacilli bacterium]MBQ4254414.1 hypothetical protein [Bacilli bacterium]
MKKVRKKSYLFLGLPVFILGVVADVIILLSFMQGTVAEGNKIFMIVLAAFAGAAAIAGLIGIILFFARKYEPKQ